MTRAAFVLAAFLAVSGCTDTQPEVTAPATLAAAALGGAGDPDVVAVNLARDAFADASRLYGRPAAAARAAAALDYLAGRFAAGSRWVDVSGQTQAQLLQARQDMRDALGVLPDAPSQLVVDRLLAVAAALDDPAQAGAAAQQLQGPPFALPADQVLQRLSNLPYLRIANVATMRAASEMFDSSPVGF